MPLLMTIARCACIRFASDEWRCAHGGSIQFNVWLPKNIFVLMTDLMRKMEASAARRRSNRHTSRQYFCLETERTRRLEYIIQPNSQIAKQLHISKKFDEKSSHLQLLLLRCALRCRCFFFFSSRPSFGYIPLVHWQSGWCGATRRKYRLNLEWSKTINSKQYGIAMPPAKHGDKPTNVFRVEADAREKGQWNVEWLER